VKWFKAAGWYGKLGMCCLYGHGVEQNGEEAVNCFLAADDKDMLGEDVYKGAHGLDPELEYEGIEELLASKN
jgi:hypothetical protein